MNTLQTLQQKFNLNLDNKRLPIELPNMGRKEFAGLLNELGFKKGVEVGVAWGFYSEVLCEAIPDLELYGVDPYEPHEGYVDYKLKSTFKKLEDQAHEKLDKYPNYHFVRKLSADALDDFEDGSLDFVYLDGDHSFEAVVFDIANWRKKIKPGGILFGHDYARQERDGVNIRVLEAVNAYMGANRVSPWFVIGNHANNEGLIRDRIRSWALVV